MADTKKHQDKKENEFKQPKLTNEQKHSSIIQMLDVQRDSNITRVYAAIRTFK